MNDHQKETSLVKDVFIGLGIAIVALAVFAVAAVGFLATEDNELIALLAALGVTVWTGVAALLVHVLVHSWRDRRRDKAVTDD